MLETILLLCFCLLTGLLSLVVVVWLVATGGLFNLDNLMLTLISLTLGGIFLGIFGWSVRSGEFREALDQLRRRSGGSGTSSGPPKA